MQRSTVVLPEPLGPMIATFWPRSTSKLRSCDHGQAAEGFRQVPDAKNGHSGILEEVCLDAASLASVRGREPGTVAALAKRLGASERIAGTSPPLLEAAVGSLGRRPAFGPVDAAR